ncbi:MAG: CbtB domain-containing protein [Dehalococcoidia bacterium]
MGKPFGGTGAFPKWTGESNERLSGNSDHRAAKVAPALLLMAAGLATLFVLGFAQGTMLHELVHDARHLLAFPCH